MLYTKNGFLAINYFERWLKLSQASCEIHSSKVTLKYVIEQNHVYGSMMFTGLNIIPHISKN